MLMNHPNDIIVPHHNNIHWSISSPQVSVSIHYRLSTQLVVFFYWHTWQHNTTLNPSTHTLKPLGTDENLCSAVEGLKVLVVVVLLHAWAGVRCGPEVNGVSGDLPEQYSHTLWDGNDEANAHHLPRMTRTHWRGENSIQHTYTWRRSSV